MDSDDKMQELRARRDRITKFPGVDKKKAVDLTPHSLRVQGLVKKVAERCSGEDAVFDVWAKRHLATQGGMMNGIAGLPLATDAYARGLQAGLKAHIPIADDEHFQQKRLEFGELIARSVARYTIINAVSKIITEDEKGVLQSCDACEESLKRLEELKGENVKRMEHPLVKAQRVFGEKIVDLRTGKNQPGIPGDQQKEMERTFRLLQDLYLKCFGAMFPG